MILEGFRVLELANGRPPGMLCGHLLADMGAEVIKVQGPSEARGNRQRDQAYDGLNRNKKSVLLDLKEPSALEAFHRLVRTSDVVIECNRPGTTRRLGIDYEALSQDHPRLVYCSITGFGQTGPYAQIGLHDTETAGARAAFYQTDDTIITPTMFGVLLSDPAGALHAAIGILGALLARSRTGSGTYIDISMADSISTFTLGRMEAALKGQPELFGLGRAHANGRYIYDRVAFRCKDNGFLLTTNPEHWDRFCDLIGRPDLVELDQERDPEVRRKAIDEIRAIMLTRTRNEWFQAITATGASAAPCLEPAEVIEDPQVIARGLIWELEHPSDGAVKQWGFPIAFSDEPASFRSFAPLLGEHTADILGELGYSAEEIEGFQS